MRVRTRALPLVLCLVGLAWSTLGAQEQEQPFRIGTKTVPAEVVAWQALETPVAEMATSGPAGLIRAYEAVPEVGLTPIGPCLMVFTGHWPPENNVLQWEVQIPVANDVSAEQYPEGDYVQVKALPERLVAYTYHVGPMEETATSLNRLLQWVGTAGLKVLGPIWVVVYEDPSTHPQGGVAELQVGVAEQ